ncbi:MAG: protein translocase subunit SecD [Candidatus Omnitrophica bacterium]|nr:protein translocase subunit SecD [Candidatus Omnitrophota bacterium]
MNNLKWKAIFIVAVTAVALYGLFPIKERINLGLDLQGGMHLVLRVDTSNLPEKQKEDATERALEIVRNRIDQFGVKEPMITRQGRDGLVVQLPGVTERQRAIDLIGKTALLEFKLVSDDLEQLKQAREGNVPEGYELKTDEKGNDLLVRKDASLIGDTLVDASVKFDQSTFGEPYVGIKFNAKGGEIFSRVTGENVGKRLAIVLDGVVQSAPVIRERIPRGEAQITGNFTVAEANDLAIVLKAGALPAPIKIEEERTIGPLLGQDSIRSGVRAAAIGGMLVLLFMVIYYYAAGFIANIALALNILYILGFMGLFHATLTLPGIAGLILTMGMSVDANVLINERIREELKLGKSIRAAVAAGYHKAFSAIFDSNLTTIAAAILLFQFGTGPVKGFAVTLTWGIAASMFTAIVVTRVIFDFLLSRNLLKKLPMLQLFPQTKIDFIGKRWFCYTISAVVIISGLFIFWQRGEKNYGIDFSGGTVVQYEFSKDIKIDEIRKALSDIGLGQASIQQFRDRPREISIKTQQDMSNQIEAEFKAKFPENKFDVLRVETVGPAVGRELKKNAFWALVLGLVAIMIYVTLRFNLKYGIAGVIGLFHDVFIAVGALALAHRQFDLTIVAALLTIAGYSINDTVVIYDRIRENLRMAKKEGLKDVINLSVNQTLSRTILTNFTTLSVVVVLFMFGGDVLSDFSYCLLVGFISGVYSTVYISSPLLIAWEKKRKK